jgi:hypothetical protein
LNIIVKWLKSHDITFIYSNARVGYGYVNHGVSARLVKDFELSIQTHPDIASYAFAETAIAYKGKLKYILHYKWDVKRWKTPEELFEHIESLQELLKDYKEIDDHTIELANGKIIDLNVRDDAGLDYEFDSGSDCALEEDPKEDIIS